MGRLGGLANTLIGLLPLRGRGAEGEVIGGGGGPLEDAFEGVERGEGGEGGGREGAGEEGGGGGPLAAPLAKGLGWERVEDSREQRGRGQEERRVHLLLLLLVLVLVVQVMLVLVLRRRRRGSRHDVRVERLNWREASGEGHISQRDRERGGLE